MWLKERLTSAESLDERPGHVGDIEPEGKENCNTRRPIVYEENRRYCKRSAKRITADVAQKHPGVRKVVWKEAGSCGGSRQRKNNER